MRLLNRILIVLLVVMLPMTAVLAAANAVTRLPDLYGHEFKGSQILDEIGLDAEPEEIAGLFSAYLTGQAVEFQLTAEYQGREKAVFTTEEQIGMQNVRRLLDRALILAAAMAVLSAALVYYFIARDQKERVRSAFKLSVLVFLLLWGACIAALISFQDRVLSELVFVGGFDPEGVLAMLLGSGFTNLWLVVNIVASCVLMFVFGSLLYKFTKERRMFVA